MSRYLLVLALCFLELLTPALVKAMNECYNPQTNEPQVCLPPFVNAAFEKFVDATNTCGLTEPEEYCLQTGVTGVTKSCHTCYVDDPTRHHSASFLTDISDERKPTWWQSQTMIADVQHPSMVNLTLDLGKTFDITYVRLKFHSSRPESFAIYKKSCLTCEWEPYQYYSGTCHRTYDLDNKDVITTEDEKKALCTEDYSDISPLTGGNVAFSTLEGRPSAYNFDRSKVLQDWVSAVAIRVSLNRINTFGDEVFRDTKVLKSYYYAISDFAVGGRCKCNGHASECQLSDTGKLACVCQHNTKGDDCEQCDDLYNDAPWQRGGDGSAHECRMCDCNGLAEKCVFDPELYRVTGGHGGKCIGCRDNTAGDHCEDCLPNHYRDPRTNRCISCRCSVTGSVSQQCDSNGKCRCKNGVGGDKCSQCLSGYYGLSEAGCSLCQCSAFGTEPDTICDPVTGACVCKLNVERAQCDRCKPGTMNLQYENPYGCTACFCHGHSSLCEVAGGYTVAKIISVFERGDDGWTASHSRGGLRSDVSWSRDRIALSENLLFSAPAKFLGEQRFSYNQFLEFVLSTDGGSSFFSRDDGSGSSPLHYARTSPFDLVIEGDQFRVRSSLTDQNNLPPSGSPQVYRFRLHEAAGFKPVLSAFQFQKMLNDIKSIRIRAVDSDTYLHSVTLDTAELGGSGDPARWIEYCDVEGYLDNFAESCSPGYTREPANGGKYAPCVPCECNGHGNQCDPETGVCKCLENTAGDHCEICKVGYYKNPEDDQCVPCPCPNNIACAITSDGVVKCLSCPPGHIGNHCEFCMDGWFGDPRGLGQCQRCTCNGNIDMNAIMNCDRVTGECLKCIHNTTGARCERCLEGYYGQPVADNPDDRCRACECFSLGSHSAVQCDTATGQCSCLPFVKGKRCDQCQDGYWNIQSGGGCMSCECHPVGATTGECDQDTGTCDCLPGVTGQHCDHCLPNHYRLTRDGCTPCNCSAVGSANLQCNEDGYCECKDGVLGVKCDQCQENYFDISSGCIECPLCYGLVQDAVDTHRSELADLERMADGIGDRPVSGGEDFLEKLEKLKRTLQNMLPQSQQMDGDRKELDEKLGEVQDQIKKLFVKLAAVENKVDSCAENMENANETTTDSLQKSDMIGMKLDEAQKQLDKAMKHINQAKVIAQDSLNKENNMTRLAVEADALADQHEQESEAVVSTAQEALDTSRNALDSIQEAITTLDDLINDFEDMSQTRLPTALALRNELSKLAENVLGKASDSKNNATDLLTEANKLEQSMPTYNTEDMDLAAQEIIERASNLLPRIDALNEEYMEGHGKLQADIERAQTLLNMADALQDTTDMLTAKAHNAREIAFEAVAKGDAAYQSVLDIKKSLEAFDEQIAENRGKAEEAMLLAPEIQATIDGANAKTAEAQNALGSARATATQARGKAENAQNLAQEIQNKAATIRSEAESANSEINDVKNAVNDLAGEVHSTGANLELAVDEANANADKVSNATDEAASAKAKAVAAKRKVDEVLILLRELQGKLDAIPDVNDKEMANMQDQYDLLLADVNEADIETSIDELQKAVDNQADMLKKYDHDLALLREDIANLKQINETLPRTCFTNSDVERQ